MHLSCAFKCSKHSLGNYIGFGFLFFSVFNLSQACETHYDSSICYESFLAHGFSFHLEAVDVGNGDDRGSHVPGEPHEGAQGHKNAHPEQVQMVASSLLQGRQERRSYLGACC